MQEKRIFTDRFGVAYNHIPHWHPYKLIGMMEIVFMLRGFKFEPIVANKKLLLQAVLKLRKMHA